MQSLQDLLDDRYTRLDEVRAWLDALDHDGRVAAIGGLSRANLRRLYQLAADGGPLGVEDFVPAETPALTEVVHWGVNSLPAFRQFQKRFCRPAPGASEALLWGYNEQDFKVVTGPGYFVVREGDAKAPLWIDYRALPEGKPYGWPPIVPNSARLGWAVYNGTVDKMRRVSAHVTVGEAWKGPKPIGAWFALCREDRA